MSQDKTNVLDTDVIIFPMPHREASREKSIEDTDGGFETEKEPSSTIRKEKFARLRRSLRKKSVSIL
jgi:hemerythrin-like domain-containing protein